MRIYDFMHIYRSFGSDYLHQDCYRQRNIITAAELVVSNFCAQEVKNVKAVEDFVHLVLTSYIIAATENVQLASRTNHTMLVSKQIVNKLSIGKESNHTNTNNPDYVPAYPKTLSLLWLEYHDAIQEGDG